MRSAAPGILPVIALDRSAAKPLYLQICDAYREAIADGRLRASQRLPSTRTLAAALEVSRIVVLGAFGQLLAEGYFETRRGAGTYVSSTLPSDSSLKRPSAAAAPRRPGAREVAARPSSCCASRRSPSPGCAASARSA